jgi:hypothetical protein
MSAGTIYQNSRGMETSWDEQDVGWGEIRR